MTFKVLDWNIQGRKYYTSTNLSKIVPILEGVDADILCIQESQDLKKQLPNITALRSYYPVLAQNEGWNDNLILSRLPVLSSGDLSFPSTTETVLEGALWADIDVSGHVLRIYSCHMGIIGLGPKDRIRQLEHVLEHSSTHVGPAIICGDMNTTIPPAGIRRKIVQWFHREPDDSIPVNGQNFISDERYVFAEIAERAGFRESIDITKSTWCIPPLCFELFDLKLDWFLVRDVKVQNVALSDYVSDHRSVTAECTLASK